MAYQVGKIVTNLGHRYIGGGSFFVGGEKKADRWGPSARTISQSFYISSTVTCTRIGSRGIEN